MQRDSATATRTQDKKLRSTFGSRNRRLCGRLKDPKFPPESAERKCQVVDPNRQALGVGITDVKFGQIGVLSIIEE